MWWDVARFFNWEGLAMGSRFCDRCRPSRPWPSNPDYGECPVCNGKTTYRADKEPMTVEAAEKIIAAFHADLADFENDWAAAEAVAQAHDLDVADLLVAKRPRPEAA